MPSQRAITCRINALKNRQRKHRAQEELLHYAGNVFYELSDRGVEPDSAEWKETKKQFERIEKLFGVVVGSTTF